MRAGVVSGERPVRVNGMGVKKGAKWSRLDNAAKIFPSTSKKTDTSVFRFYCELKEEVRREPLESALGSALREFPNFLCAMRKGAFWYYLEETGTKPQVAEESKPVCSQIYDGDNSALLFEVTYSGRRINLEIFHALADGTGALQFLKTIVYYYLKEVHRDSIGSGLVFMENDASFSEKSDDGFSRYYQKHRKTSGERQRAAYKIRCRRNYDEPLQVIEATASVKQVLEAAHTFDTTLTVYLTAVFFEAIRKGMSLNDRSRPVVIQVPVNLRNYFPSMTTRNFFGLIDVSYDFSRESGEFSDLIEKIDAGFREKLTRENLAARMNKLAGIERNFFAKIAPLPLKNIALRAARGLDESHQTAVISNIGRITMPEEMSGYIDLFGVLASTLELQLCVCSFGDKLQMSFTSAFQSTDLQKNFIRLLTSHGVEIQIRSNDFYRGKGEKA